ncbi:MAG: hypothetical protein E5V49_09490 [Mesorhizobium sp.]|nr:hypothetical protein EN848_12995 [bacterium M00.F.Ca.ET.205.01.1.1]TGU47483.1 hypothetical protein EN795_29590 [bacterium M00.F.Ca.ET.152.01.1.1]TGV32184.1 hypothetical protein EN829_029130 [Mesorhizobium sp. M00.F.Ca.ET.186.01.1.1]TGZ39260.1 hypothetical protein EN805_29700 [bacterium M00.F.Ca.ET.162.01.1.1]TIW60813.1 MAG: hypothetical protein E5V48_12035 [Mesorhizobium sp.]
MADNGLTLEAIPSVAARYALKYPDPEDVVLNVDINFARAPDGGGNAIPRLRFQPGLTNLGEGLFRRAG